MEPEPGRLGVGEFAFPGPLRDQLVAAIIAGTKTTTTGLLADYELDAEPLPRSGDRQVVIDSAGVPVALIEIVDARVVRVGDIDVPHAVGEGEGYASVAEWRSGHEKFWHSREYRQYRGDPAFTVTDDTLAVAQQFRMVADDHQDLGSLLQRAREADGDRGQLSPSPAGPCHNEEPATTRHARSRSAAGVQAADARQRTAYRPGRSSQMNPLGSSRSATGHAGDAAAAKSGR